MFYESYKDYCEQRILGIKMLIDVNPFITSYEIAMIQNKGVYEWNNIGGQISAINRTRKKLNSEQNPERSVATEADSSNEAGNQSS